MEESLVSGPCVSFRVEKIIGISSGGTFQVQWAPSWVSRFQLVGCERLIHEFLQQQKSQKKVHEVTPLSQEKSHSSNEHIAVYKARASDEAEPQTNTNELLSANDTYTSGLSVGTEQFESSEARVVKIDVEAEEPSLGDTQNEGRDVRGKISSSTVIPQNDAQLEPIELDIKIEENEKVDEIRSILVLPGFEENASDINEERRHGNPYTSFDSSRTALSATEWDCSIDNNDIRDDSSERHYACHYCSECFSEKDSLDEHIILHLQDQLYMSQYGNKQFAPNSLLTKHRSHQRKKRFACSHCDYRFESQGNLEKHIRTHSGEKPFSCEECGKCFSQKGNLKRHMLCHKMPSTSELTCDLCGDFFMQSNHLSQHRRRCTSVFKFLQD